MKVIPISPRGFCPGVVRAIDIIERVLADPTYPRPIQILGMIVHNRHVVDRLTRMGAVTLFDSGKTRLELLEGLTHGTVVITAHGAQPAVFELAREKGLTTVDATCTDVYRTHDLIRARLEAGYQVVFVGKSAHPESEAVLGLGPEVTLIETEADARGLTLPEKPVFATNQTTLSIRDTDSIFSILKTRFPEIIIHDEICNSTRIRQEAIIETNSREAVDLCYIVGDRHSNNTLNLVRISERETGIRTLLIESLADLDKRDLLGVKTISVSSGASTPTEVTKAVIDFLRNLSETD